jgi:hypothetical protein
MFKKSRKTWQSFLQNALHLNSPMCKYFLSSISSPFAYVSDVSGDLSDHFPLEKTSETKTLFIVVLDGCH